MVQIHKETVRYLARLCRIACTEEQENALLHDMKEVLSYIDLLNEVPTDGVTPCNNVSMSCMQTPLRADTVKQTLSAKDFFENVPQHTARLVRIPPVRGQGG